MKGQGGINPIFHNVNRGFDVYILRETVWNGREWGRQAHNNAYLCIIM
jgi:hypothetical protein